jgi:HlyD family secretion protein
MVHQQIKSLPHHPKRVIIISLLIALGLGIFGYLKINKTIPIPVVEENSGVNTNDNNSPSGSENITLGFLASGRIKTVSVKAGDKVKAGQILATLDAENTEGALAQAKATYQTAVANYQKIINGATSSAIDVAKSAVNSAQVNLDGATKQQNLLAANAYANLLNSTISADSTNSDNSAITPPAITGSFSKNVEGEITLTVNQTGEGGYVNFSGLEAGTTPVSTSIPEAIGNTGLYIEFPSVNPYIGTTWEINIPNKNAPNYLAIYNAYQSALTTKSQVVANAQAALDQANAVLDALVTVARPEDVAMAQAQMNNAEGSVQIAEATYENTIITAPADGTIVSVAIAPGQIATPNAPAIQFTSN